MRGHSFPAGGQIVTDGIRGLGREKQLPRRLRCSGLAALRSAAGLPPDLPVVLQSPAEKDG